MPISGPSKSKCPALALEQHVLFLVNIFLQVIGVTCKPV